jgi:hypothetical protein
VTTIYALKAELAAAGISADSVMWDDEPWQRADGAWVLSRLPDGRIRSSLRERGRESHVEVFDDEERAAQVLRKRLMVFAKDGRGREERKDEDA